LQLSEQLKGRRVFRAVVGYGIVAFALLQVIEPIMHGLHLPEATLTYALFALGLAFPLVVAISWALDAMRGEAPVRWTPQLTALTLAVLAILAATALVVIPPTAPTALPRLVQVTFTEGIEEHPTWSPDGKQILYVAQSGKVRKIFRKNLVSGEDKQLSAGDHDEIQPAWSPDGESVLFLRARQPNQMLQPADVFGQFVDDADIFRRDLRSGKETWLIGGAYDPAPSPDGMHIAVDASWAGPRRIWILDAQAHNPQQATTDSSEEIVHIAPAWSPDGKKIAFQNIERTKFDIRVVDLESKAQTFLTDDYSIDIRPTWSSSGKFVYFSSDRGGGTNIWRATPQGALQQVTTGAGQDVEVAISRDGKRMAFVTLRQNADLWRLPVSPRTGLATGQPEAVISTTREDSRGAWSPDGTSIAFNSDRSGEMNIWIHSLAQGSARQLTTGRGGDFQPNWSPDMKKIAFFSSRSGKPNIWLAEVPGGALRQLTAGESRSVNPFFSPDGARIAFQSDRSGRLEVWVMNADGSGARQLTNLGITGHFMRWTDSGAGIIFRCTCGGKPATMLVPAAGGEAVKFAEQKGGSHISFSPDRSRIMDVLYHRVLWVSPVKGGPPEKVFEFSDPSIRIDYPVWSPDGKWVLFDRQHPRGGDVWVMKDFE